MITLLTIILSLAIILIVAFFIFSIGGAVLLIAFGDLFFAIFVIWLIVKLIRGKKK